MAILNTLSDSGLRVCPVTAPDLTLIGAAWNLGAGRPGCESAPGALMASGMSAAFARHGIAAVWSSRIRGRTLVSQSVLGREVRRACSELALQVEGAVVSDRRFAVVGGDHSCAIGTWSGVARALGVRGPLGLVWVDAHMDSHTPATSRSGNLHGMPLAVLLGRGDPWLTGLCVDPPVLDPLHLCLIGVRSWEEDEFQFLEELGVRIYYMDEVCRRGLAAVMREAVETAGRGTAGFGLSIDLDALDPGQLPGVGSPVPGGLDVAELCNALRPLAGRPSLLGVEIAELNPLLDATGRSVKLAGEILLAALGTRKESDHV